MTDKITDLKIFYGVLVFLCLIIIAGSSYFTDKAKKEDTDLNGPIVFIVAGLFLLIASTIGFISLKKTYS